MPDNKPQRRPRHGLRLLCFLLLFALLFSLVSGLMRNKLYSTTRALYEEPRHSVDVLFMGSSHMLNAVAPLQLWQEQGIASVNYAQNGQVLPVSYYALQEALRFQTPDLVVLDVYKAVQDSLIDSKASLHYTLDTMKPGLPKYKAIFDLMSAGERGEYVINLIAYHTRWKELSAADLDWEGDTAEKGAQALFTTQPNTVMTVAPPEEKGTCAAVAIEYLEKIVRLCEEEGVGLLLVAVPFGVPDNDELGRQQAANAVADYAAEWGVPYLNLMHHVEEMEFSFETDLADVYHVNWQGMEKVTAYLGTYLAEHYHLPDRRSDPDYAEWHTAAAGYREYLAEKIK